MLSWAFIILCTLLIEWRWDLWGTSIQEKLICLTFLSASLEPLVDLTFLLCSNRQGHWALQRPLIAAFLAGILSVNNFRTVAEACLGMPNQKVVVQDKFYFYLLSSLKDQLEFGHGGHSSTLRPCYICVHSPIIGASLSTCLRSPKYINSSTLPLSSLLPPALPFSLSYFYLHCHHHCHHHHNLHHHHHHHQHHRYLLYDHHHPIITIIITIRPALAAPCPLVFSCLFYALFTFLEVYFQIHFGLWALVLPMTEQSCATSFLYVWGSCRFLNL